MTFLSIEEAKAARGVRLVTTRGIPVPWGEAAKAILHVKGIAFARVGQEPGGENAELKAWTGLRSAPILLIDDEPPLDRWADILIRLEQLKPEPSLIPVDEGARAQLFGLAHSLLGPDGYCTNRRLFINAQPDTRATLSAEAQERLRAHGGGDPARAPARIIQILEHFAAVLRKQQTRGSRYLLGDTLTALDLYWATSAALALPLPEDRCPLMPVIRHVYTERESSVLAATDPLLLDHRDYIYERYLATPVEL